MPRSEASAKPPRWPLQTCSTPNESSADESVPPRRPRMDKASTSDETSGNYSYSSNQSHPSNSWIPKSIQDVFFQVSFHARSVFVEVKEHILTYFPGLAPPFGMIAWLQFRYMQYLKGVTTAESFKFIELRLASHTTAKDREVNKLRVLLGEWEKASDRAVTAAEAAVDAKQIADQKAADEIARLQTLIEDGGNALTKEQESFEQKLGEAAEETARLHKKQISTLEREKEISKKALEKAKDDGAREARRLTDLAIEKNSETAERRKADKATIDALKKQSTADTNTILELTKKVGTIAKKDETIVSMGTEARNMTREVRDLKKDRDRAVEDGIKATKATKATVAQLNAQIIEVNNLRKAAEAKTVNQEALVVEAIEQRKVAEQRATQQETRAAEAEASCEAAEEKASREEAKATEAAEQLETKDKKITTLTADSDCSIRYLQRRLDAVTEENAGMGASLDQARADAQEAGAKAKETEKALQERITKLEDLLQEKSIWTGTTALSSDSSSQELSMLPQPRPVVRFPVCPASNSPSSADQRPLENQQGQRQEPACDANRPGPRCRPPAKTKTPPEERGLPAYTPTGPKANRG